MRKTSIAVLIAVLAGLPATPPLHSQQTTGSDAVSAPVCMTGRFADDEAVSFESRGRIFPIVVAEADVAALETAGFAEIQCARSDLASRSKRTAWRDEICELAAIPNDAVQAQLTRMYGAAPSVLCGSAELVTEQWTPKKD